MRALLFLVMTAWLATACTTLNTVGKRIQTQPEDRWVILPFHNYSQMPRAGENTERILKALIRNKGIEPDLYPYEMVASPLLLVDDTRRYEKALRWARNKGYRYGLSGSVNEWRYKAGLDGEPAVGLTVNVIDIETGQVLWSGTGAHSGWGRESVSMIAHKLLRKMLKDLTIAWTENTKK